jgi:heme/copper-type cytochrome/quinol oxidase subunit 2
MNTPTIVVTLLIFWLVMGLGFLSKYITARNKGKTRYEAWTSYEGLLFISSVVISLIVLLYKTLSG